MSKIYGFKESDVIGLIEYLKTNTNKQKNKLFIDYACLVGKSNGTVRNLYYAIVKASKLDVEFSNKYLNGMSISVKKVEKFNTREEKELIEKISEEKSKGKSVRSIIYQLAGGDEKLFLRYQNKYRNAIKKLKQTIETSQNENYSVNEIQYRRLKKEINDLVTKISASVKEENARLLRQIKILQDENLSLKKKYETNSIKYLNKII